jgi:hypothetical protein
MLQALYDWLDYHWHREHHDLAELYTCARYAAQLRLQTELLLEEVYTAKDYQYMSHIKELVIYGRSARSRSSGAKELSQRTRKEPLHLRPSYTREFKTKTQEEASPSGEYCLYG